MYRKVRQAIQEAFSDKLDDYHIDKIIQDRDYVFYNDMTLEDVAMLCANEKEKIFGDMTGKMASLETLGYKETSQGVIYIYE